MLPMPVLLTGLVAASIVGTRTMSRRCAAIDRTARHVRKESAGPIIGLSVRIARR